MLTLCEVQVFDRTCIEPTHETGRKILPFVNGYLIKSKITVECDNGYMTNSSNRSWCQTDGTWNPRLPSCKIVQYKNLPAWNNGYYIMQTYNNNSQYQTGFSNYGSIITLYCNEGYMPASGLLRTCNASGLWSGENPRCNPVKCLYPHYLSNVNLSFDNQSIYLSGSVDYRIQISIHCNEGYTANNNESLTCMSNSSWNFQTQVCDVVRCQFPNDSLPSVRYRLKDGTFYLNGSQNYSTTIQSECVEGFRQTLEVVNRSCSSNGYWSGTTPKCIQITCKLPENLTGGEFISPLSETGHIPYNGTVQAKCALGRFRLKEANNVWTCTENGTWDRHLPTCVPLCNYSDITYLMDTRAFTENAIQVYEEGEAVQPICDAGYEPDPPKITCNNHTWSAAVTCTIIISAEMQHSSEAPTIGGASAAVVLLLLIGGVIGILLYRRRTQATKNCTSRYKDLMELDKATNANDVYAVVNNDKADCAGDANGSITEKEEYQNSGNDIFLSNQSQQAYYSFSTMTMPETAIRVKDLADLVLTGNCSAEKLMQQFERLPTGLQDSHAAALKLMNRQKNKYKNLYAYDDTRVVLQTDATNPSDYINACYIHGFSETRAYVAAQGPTKHTIIDFWRMIWQIDTGTIVMLTNLFEGTKQKCEQYWPSEGSEAYDNIKVSLRKTDVFSDFLIRTFAVTKNAEERLVNQYHFIAWNDQDVPKYASSVVHFLNKVKYSLPQSTGPMLVHCSAGVGRTGVFIAIDYLTEQAQALGYVDVAGCVEALRRQRVNLVQTLEQYVFVHHALVETLMLSSTALPASKFPDAYKEMLQIDPIKLERKINVHFKMIMKMSQEDDEYQYISAKHVKNKHKNRYSNILPVATYMPKVACETDDVYINAVFLPNYKIQRAFIITQTPTVSTQEVFWQMVIEYEIHTIVMMNLISEMQDEEIYWTTDTKTTSFGHAIVRHLKTYHVHCHKVLDLEVSNLQKNFHVKLIQCGDWEASKHVPKSPEVILKLLQIVQDWQQQTGNKPVLVHCMNGATKSGLFCVISAIIERMKIEQDVAISQVIQGMRTCREQIVTSVEQFVFCHETILAFLEQHQTYSNFSLT